MPCLDDRDNEDAGDVKEEGDGGPVVRDAVMVVMTVKMMMAEWMKARMTVVLVLILVTDGEKEEKDDSDGDGENVDSSGGGGDSDDGHGADG